MKLEFRGCVLLNLKLQQELDLSLGSVAGSVTQGSWGTTFKDGLRTETKLEVRNGLQSIHAIPEINLVSPFGAGHDPGGDVLA